MRSVMHMHAAHTQRMHTQHATREEGTQREKTGTNSDTAQHTHSAALTMTLSLRRRLAAGRPSLSPLTRQRSGSPPLLSLPSPSPSSTCGTPHTPTRTVRVVTAVVPFRSTRSDTAAAPQHRPPSATLIRLHAADSHHRQSGAGSVRHPAPRSNAHPGSFYEPHRQHQSVRAATQMALRAGGAARRTSAGATLMAVVCRRRCVLHRSSVHPY